MVSQGWRLTELCQSRQGITRGVLQLLMEQVFGLRFWLSERNAIKCLLSETDWLACWPRVRDVKAPLHARPGRDLGGWGSGSRLGSLLGTYLSSLAYCAWLQLIQHVHLNLGPGQEGKKQRPGLSTGLVASTWLGVGCCMHALRPRGGPPPVKAWQPQLARQQPGQRNDMQCSSRSSQPCEVHVSAQAPRLACTWPAQGFQGHGCGNGIRGMLTGQPSHLGLPAVCAGLHRVGRLARESTMLSGNTPVWGFWIKGPSFRGGAQLTSPACQAKPIALDATSCSCTSGRPTASQPASCKMALQPVTVRRDSALGVFIAGSWNHNQFFYMLMTPFPATKGQGQQWCLLQNSGPYP